jgi:hypothetical protein
LTSLSNSEDFFRLYRQIPIPINAIAANPPTTHPIINPKFAGASTGCAGAISPLPPTANEVAASFEHAPTNIVMLRQFPPVNPARAERIWFWPEESGMGRKFQRTARAEACLLAGCEEKWSSRVSVESSRESRSRLKRDLREGINRLAPVRQSASSACATSEASVGKSPKYFSQVQKNQHVSTFPRHEPFLSGILSLNSVQFGNP